MLLYAKQKHLSIEIQKNLRTNAWLSPRRVRKRRNTTCRRGNCGRMWRTRSTRRLIRRQMRGLTGVELLETKQILLDAIFMRSRPNMRSFFSIKIWEFLQKAQTFTILRYSYRKASHFPLCHTQSVTQLMKIFANFNLIFVAICCIIELHLIPLHCFQQFVVLFLKFGFEV